MGKSEVRTAMKVDLNKPAAEQPGLHVIYKQPLTGFGYANPVQEQMAPG